MLSIYVIILTLGLVSSYTDIKSKKIYNIHLFIAAFLGLIFYTCLIITRQMIPDIHLLWNFLIGLAIGFLLYLTGVWGAGDAKLFTVFCFLNPAQKYSSLFFFPSIALFINIFVISTLAILILSIKDIVRNKNTILKKIFSLPTLILLLQTFLTVFALKWIIESAIDLFIPRATEFMSILILFLLYQSIRRFMRKIKDDLFLFLLLGSCLIFKFLIHPLDFNPVSLLTYFKTSCIYTFIFYSLHVLFDLNSSDGKTKTDLEKPYDKISSNPNACEDETEKTIALAPLMLLGTLLTNTDFLYWLMQLLINLGR